jgi:uncharacterized 2Fe-2S/4Fe-4S cluster protein (DUF4445 family)
MSVFIRLEPLGVTVEAAPGTPLRDVLFPYGVEFPCGGKGRCDRCRVRVLRGEGAGTSLRSCQMTAAGDLTLDIGQWEAPILSDDTRFTFAPRPGRAIAIDLGTTTLVAQLLDLETATVLGVRSALNPQAIFGSDVMSRIQHALTPQGSAELRGLIRAELGRIVAELAGRDPVESIVIAGNTVMMHLFCGFDTAPLAQAPFEPQHLELQTFDKHELGWNLDGEPIVRFLPCLGGFVGSDLLAGIIATGLAGRDEVTALIDLGTNGEVVVGNRERVLCASTAAGPAFEGGRITCGMRAATGAISEVSPGGSGALNCHVLGEAKARGICGSGLVDAVAAGLEIHAIRANGRMPQPLPLCDGLALTQSDVREVQLAKGAIAAGLRILLRRRGTHSPARIFLAGAFGNYINLASARRIGMIEFPEEIVEAVGNSALLGAKMAIFAGADYSYRDLLGRIEHVPLGSGAEFQDEFIASMHFPPE